MSIPLVQFFTLFNAIAATETKKISEAVDRPDKARSIILEINGASTPNWAVDLQGAYSADGTYHNISYFRADTTPTAISQEQLTVDWTTSQYYVIPNPPPFVRVVATRTGGTLTIKGSFSSEAYSNPGLVSGAVAPFTSTTTNGYGTQTAVTRAANTTPYTANDVVGGAIDFGVMGPSASQIIITSTLLEPRITAVPAGMTSFTLYLYSVTPPSAIADNGAWTLASGDLASYLGSISLGTPALPAASSAALIVEQANLGKQVKLAGTHLFGYLVTAGGFTPAANSEVYEIGLQSVAI